MQKIVRKVHQKKITLSFCGYIYRVKTDFIQNQFVLYVHIVSGITYIFGNTNFLKSNGISPHEEEFNEYSPS